MRFFARQCDLSVIGQAEVVSIFGHGLFTIACLVCRRLSRRESQRLLCEYRNGSLIGCASRLAHDNWRGLPEVYNEASERELARGSDDLVMVFAHDDLHLYDFHWPLRVTEATQVFDVVGVAGNTRCWPGHVSWIFDTVHFDRVPDTELSGHVGARQRPSA